MIREIRNFRISDLVKNEVQLDNRTMNVSDLQESIKANGLFYLPIVTIENGKIIIIDGHRRIRALLLNGNETTDCTFIKIPKGMTSKDLFILVNGFTKKITNKNYLYAYSQGSMLPQKYVNSIIKITADYGKSFIKFMVKNNLSIETVSRLNTFLKHIGIHKRKDIENFYNWLRSKRQFQNIIFLDKLRSAGKLDYSIISEVKKCISENKFFEIKITND